MSLETVLTLEQRELLVKHVADIEQLLASGNIENILLAIDDAIIDTFDCDGEPSVTGIKLQLIYDRIFNAE